MSLSSLILRLIQCGLLTVHTKDSRMSQLLASLISWRPKHHFLELTFSCLTSSFAIKEKSTIFSTFSLNSVVFPPCSPPFSWFLANSWTITSYMPNILEHSTWMGRAAVLILEWDLTTWTYLLKKRGFSANWAGPRNCTIEASIRCKKSLIFWAWFKASKKCEQVWLHWLVTMSLW